MNTYENEYVDRLIRKINNALSYKEICDMELYKHSKSSEIYEFICAGEHTETHQVLAIYKTFPKSECDVIRVWARPMEMFMEDVSENTPRFKKVTSFNEVFTPNEIEEMKKAIATGKYSDKIVMKNADYFRKYLEN